MPNFTILTTEQSLGHFKQYRIAVIDGAKSPSIKEFYQEIGRELDFPDYFEHNLDSLDELLNDLEWIEQENVALYFKNFDLFLSEQRKKDTISELLNLLDATAEDWKWVDEDDEFKKKNLKVLIQQCDKATAALEAEEIGFDVI
jgi:RNAse (barnase) inhibitor barstar